MECIHSDEQLLEMAKSNLSYLQLEYFKLAKKGQNPKKLTHMEQKIRLQFEEMSVIMQRISHKNNLLKPP